MTEILKNEIKIKFCTVCDCCTNIINLLVKDVLNIEVNIIMKN